MSDVDARPTSFLRGGSDRGDRTFTAAIGGLAAVVPVVLAGIIILLLVDALPAIQRYKGTFLTESTWNPVSEQFGARPTSSAWAPSPRRGTRRSS